MSASATSVSALGSATRSPLPGTLQSGRGLFNTSAQLRISFSVPVGEHTSQLCRFALDEDPDFAAWVEKLAHALHQQRQLAAVAPEVRSASSVQELLDEADESSARALAELGVLTRRPGDLRWSWRSEVRLLLTTRTREMGHPLCEVHWSLPLIARVLAWVRQQRDDAAGESPAEDEAFSAALQRAKLLIQQAPAEIAFERCFSSERLPGTDQPWVIHPQHQLEGSTLWVQEPATGTRLPSHVETEEYAALVATLHEGSPVEDLPASLQAKLWQAGLLRHAAHDRDRAAHLVSEQHAAAERLIHDGQATLRGILTAPELLRWNVYCDVLYHAGYFPPKTTGGSGPLRSTLYAEPAIRRLHQPLAELLSKVAGEPLEPSYCILARYFEGATLPRHTDRPQCAWNFSLVLHWQAEEGTPSPWPFFVAGPGGVVNDVRLGPGDGVLYRGTESPHWREALPRGNATTVAFFHFVPPTFQGHRG